MEEEPMDDSYLHIIVILSSSLQMNSTSHRSDTFIVCFYQDIDTLKNRDRWYFCRLKFGFSEIEVRHLLSTKVIQKKTFSLSITGHVQWTMHLVYNIFFKTILVICAGDWTEHIYPLSSFHHAGTEWELSEGGGQQLIADELQLWGLGAGNKKQDMGVKWHRHSARYVLDHAGTFLVAAQLLSIRGRHMRNHAGGWEAHYSEQLLHSIESVSLPAVKVLEVHTHVE